MPTIESDLQFTCAKLRPRSKVAVILFVLGLLMGFGPLMGYLSIPEQARSMGCSTWPWECRV